MKNNLHSSKFTHTKLTNGKRKRNDTTDKSIKKKKSDLDWIAATATRNSILNDGFLDLIERKSPLLKDFSDDIFECHKSDKSSRTKNFTSSIMEQGRIFEQKINDVLIKKFSSEEIINIYGNSDARSDLKYQETLQAIQNKVPIIIAGVVRNHDNRTFGIPDLIVRNDYISKFITLNPVKKSKKKFYYIIDIKLTTLYLMADGIHLRNSGSIPAYKAQLFIYNEALAEMQGYNPRQAFILGWKWKYTSKKIQYKGNNCFERLGTIDFNDRDEEYVKRTEDSVKWLRELKDNEGSWDLSESPLPHKNLYPNMCNHMDFPYRKIKETFAQSINDITLLWQCGPKQRARAHKKEIYDWKDIRCTPKALGFKDGPRSKILTRVLEANSGEYEVVPKYIKSDLGDWKKPECQELYVDFESTCSVFTNFDTLPESSSESMIYMIGLGYIEKGQWKYVSFTVKSLDYDEEFRICDEFVRFIGDNDPQLVHWSHAEPTMWKRMMSRNSEKVRGWNAINWFDLLKLFHEEPIGVKGCLAYGLKEIATMFHKHGFIETIWNSKSSCVSGIDASVGAYVAWNEAKEKGLELTDIPLLSEIEKYNEIDCKVLQEIICYLRENHIKK
jgi:predicted RecB family nuclease